LLGAAWQMAQEGKKVARGKMRMKREERRFE
jgi:hypothetical protein